MAWIALLITFIAVPLLILVAGYAVIDLFEKPEPQQSREMRAFREAAKRAGTYTTLREWN